VRLEMPRSSSYFRISGWVSTTVKVLSSPSSAN
jgi:hypothetical protein